MKSIAFIIICFAVLSPAKGRDIRDIYPGNWVETFVSNGTYHTINAFVYKHTWADFPDFGKDCTAYINAGGLLIESPYFEGDIKITIKAVPESTPQERDVLKGGL